MTGLQLHPNPLVYAKTTSFISKFCSPYLMDLDEEIDLFIEEQKPKTTKVTEEDETVTEEKKAEKLVVTKQTSKVKTATTLRN